MIKKKTSMTSFDVAASVSEINRLLAGVRLSNIYSFPGRRGLILRFKGGGVDARVVAVPEERIHVTSYDVAEKGMPPPFVMALRKYLRGSQLLEARQLGFDRIVVLVFGRGRAEAARLVVEVLPRGVAALLDAGGRIVQTSSSRQMKDRVLRRGVEYRPPPGSPPRPLELGPGQVAEALEGCGAEAARCLARGLGYPGEAVEEALLRLGFKPSENASALRGAEEQLAEALRTLYRECSEAGKGYVLRGDEGPLTATCFEPRGLAEAYGLRVGEYEAPGRAYDEYFAELARSLQEQQLSREIEAQRARLLASLKKAEESLRENLEKARRLEALAERLAANMPQLYEAVECARHVREESGWDYIPGNCPGVVDVEPSRGLLRVSLGGEIVEVDIRRDPGQLLVDIYKRIGELKAKAERGAKAVEEVKAKLAELEKRAAEARMRGRAGLRKRLWFERYHWIITSNGFLAVAGRNADQNESIVKRYLNERRIFMHADVHGAPVEVVFAEGREPPEADLREAALLTAAYSKAWKAGVGSVDVYWVWGGQVSKSPPSGEYISKGSFMVYGKRNYIRAVELRLALGVGLEDSAPVLLVGPEELVRRRSSVYAVLVPGDEDPSLLAKKLRTVFREKIGGPAAALSVDELRAKIPGRSRMIAVRRGEASEQPRPLRGLPGEEDEEG